MHLRSRVRSGKRTVHIRFEENCAQRYYFYEDASRRMRRYKAKEMSLQKRGKLNEQEKNE